jgi:hypothetical protein
MDDWSCCRWTPFLTERREMISKGNSDWHRYDELRCPIWFKWNEIERRFRWLSIDCLLIAPAFADTSNNSGQASNFKERSVTNSRVSAVARFFVIDRGLVRLNKVIAPQKQTGVYDWATDQLDSEELLRSLTAGSMCKPCEVPDTRLLAVKRTLDRSNLGWATWNEVAW